MKYQFRRTGKIGHCTIVQGAAEITAAKTLILNSDHKFMLYSELQYRQQDDSSQGRSLDFVKAKPKSIPSVHPFPLDPPSASPFLFTLSPFFDPIHPLFLRSRPFIFPGSRTLPSGRRSGIEPEIFKISVFNFVRFGDESRSLRRSSFTLVRKDHTTVRSYWYICRRCNGPRRVGCRP